VIWLASWPRSGNTLARLIIQHCWDRDCPSIYNEPMLDGLLPNRRAYVNPPVPGITMRFHLPGAVVKTHRWPIEGDDRPAIYVVRDGRDACCSMAAMYNRPVRYVIDGLPSWQRWAEHVARWAPWPGGRPNTLLVRYEDLLERPGWAIGEMAKTLGPPVRTDWRNDFDRFRRLVPKIFRKGRIGTWRHEMSAEDEARFWEIHGWAMERLGYARTATTAPQNL